MSINDLTFSEMKYPIETINLLLDRLYLLCESNQTQEACNLLFFNIDTYLLDGEFEKVDLFLRSININRISTSSMRSILCLTKDVENLSFRKTFYGLVYDKMLELKGEALTKRLIGGLN